MSYERTFHGEEEGPEGGGTYMFELDREWRVVRLNTAAKQRLGMGDAAVGLNYWDIFPLSSGTYTRDILEEALEKDVRTKFQAYCQDVDAWFQIDASPTRRGLRLVAREVKTGEADYSQDQSLSEEGLSKIAEEMRRMADQIVMKALEGKTAHAAPDDETWTDRRLACVADAIYRDRRRRRDHFPVEFAEPQWNILLDLFIHEVRGVRVSVTSACIAADVPSTTALRALRELTDQGLISREEDVNDRRRVWVALTETGMEAMRCYLRHSTVAAVAP